MYKPQNEPTQNTIQHEKFEHQNVANIMENERFELQSVAIPLKWQLPAPKCCENGQNSRCKKNNTEKIIPKIIPDHFAFNLLQVCRHGWGLRDDFWWSHLPLHIEPGQCRASVPFRVPMFFSLKRTSNSVIFVNICLMTLYILYRLF